MAAHHLIGPFIEPDGLVRTDRSDEPQAAFAPWRVAGYSDASLLRAGVPC
ncbi:MAG: hypothetical protein ACODAF_04105 [Actinomycetota bacterium]